MAQFLDHTKIYTPTQQPAAHSHNLSSSFNLIIIHPAPSRLPPSTFHQPPSLIPTPWPLFISTASEIPTQGLVGGSCHWLGDGEEIRWKSIATETYTILARLLLDQVLSICGLPSPPLADPNYPQIYPSKFSYRPHPRSSPKIWLVVDSKSLAGKTYKEFRKKETVLLPFCIILNELRYCLRIDYSLATN